MGRGELDWGRVREWLGKEEEGHGDGGPYRRKVGMSNTAR